MKQVFATPRRTARATEPIFPAEITSPVPVYDRIPRGLLPEDLSEALERVYRAHVSTRQGTRLHLEEVRLRAGRCVTLTVGGVNLSTDIVLTSASLETLLWHLCGGSLYAYSDTIRDGYLTLPGGVRVGVAGRASCEEGRIIGIRDISALCIRLPHRHDHVGGVICRLLREMEREGGAPRGLLVFAPPGVGKTTLLRGVAAGMASGKDPRRTVVVDTRGELGFEADTPGLCLDVLSGYPRARGVEIATRTLAAQLIVCDEIGDVEEAMALISAHHGGVPLVASAHAGCVEELLRRTGLHLLHEARLFGAYVGLARDGGTVPSGCVAGGDGFVYHITPWATAEARLMGREEETLCSAK